MGDTDNSQCSNWPLAFKLYQSSDDSGLSSCKFSTLPRSASLDKFEENIETYAAKIKDSHWYRTIDLSSSHGGSISGLSDDYASVQEQNWESGSSSQESDGWDSSAESETGSRFRRLFADSYDNEEVTIEPCRRKEEGESYLGFKVNEVQECLGVCSRKVTSGSVSNFSSSSPTSSSDNTDESEEETEKLPILRPAKFEPSQCYINHANDDWYHHDFQTFTPEERQNDGVIRKLLGYLNYQRRLKMQDIKRRRGC